MLRIDGSQGEGGGQILRSSLALSLATGTPVQLDNIRAGRKKPGLLRQHLTAVRAATRVGCAEVTGDELGSTSITFRPATLQGGHIEVDIGSAGSTTLVLQTVLVPLLLAKEPSTLVLRGGTHNPMAPPFGFLTDAFLPHLRRMGAEVELELVRPGFYPAGGGEFQARIQPLGDPRPLEILERGEEKGVRGHVLVARLPRRIAEEERTQLAKSLTWKPHHIVIEERGDSPCPGNVVSARLDYENTSEVFTSFGQRGIPARRVAKRAAAEVSSYLASDAPVGEYLADQLLVPMALLAGGCYRTHLPSPHTRTNIDTVRKFLPESITLNEETESGSAVIRVQA